MSAAAASTASAIANAADVNVILEQIKSLNTIDLLKVASAATTLAAKNVKGKKTPKSALAPSPSKKGKRAAAKKPTKGSDTDVSTDASSKKSNRGAQLVKPRAWVTYTLEDAKTNGWAAFTITQSKKDKVTGEKTETAVEVPASAPEPVDGEYVFPDGKKFNHKYAMSLSKNYWSVKTQSGDRKDLYEAFEATYVPPAASATETDVTDADD